MHLNVFSKVYCDRVYFSCAERNMTGSGFDPPPPGGGGGQGLGAIIAGGIVAGAIIAGAIVGEAL